jgi:ATP-binding cassette subfamily B protein
LLVPEVVQISAMDCGPAALKSVLEGHGIFASYGRLREACQTGVDGTSIDTLEELARQAGLHASQTMLPVDHLLLSEASALPAIVVARLPNGLTHFLVVWSRVGGLVQIMDPATGRRWPTCEQLLRELFVHSTFVSPKSWRAWAGSPKFVRPLGRRLQRVGFPDAGRKHIEEARSDPTWRSLAELDAATRMVESVIIAGGLPRGPRAARVLDAFLAQSRSEALDGTVEELTIPEAFWTVLPEDPKKPSGRLYFRGAVVVTVRERPTQPSKAAAVPMASGSQGHPTPDVAAAKDGAARSLELSAALNERPARPARELLRLMRDEGAFTAAALFGAIALASAMVLLEALLFRSLFEVGRFLGSPEQHLPAGAMLLAFLVGVLLLELPITAELQRLGRQLEARLRMAFLEKLPRLNDRYLQSRPTSDMAERCHAVHRLRLAPTTAGNLARSVFELSLTAAGIVWLDPASAPAAVTLALVSVVLPLATQPLLAERDFRVRSHAGALSRFYLDALLGLIPIRTHGAERAVRREHEGLLVEWTRAGRLLLRGALAIDGVTSLVSFSLAAWVFMGYVEHAGAASGALLLLYWALNLPMLGQEIAGIVRQYPAHRNVALRLLEPLGALEDRPAGEPNLKAPAEEQILASGGGPSAEIRFDGISVVAAGHTILKDVDFTIAAGEHVAVVGPSGAGKSTLIGLLLGWHRPATGAVLVDGRPLDDACLDRLRTETAWVDPAVQIWNRSLLENLTYGAPDAQGVGRTIEAADLRGVLEGMPDGLQTVLGEGGGLVSGGEGQRVRLGRAMARSKPRLALLDEPFRGLDRERRQAMLSRTRAQWAGVTLICVTHDIRETVGFERVLVVEGGCVVEDDAPANLMNQPGSRYRALLDAETAVHETMWSGTTWRRLRIERGRIVEAQGTSP